MDWQDLHFFLTLARCGSLSAIARELGVDHATVGRQVAALGSSLGLRLTERLPRRTMLTGHRRIIVSDADGMHRIANRIQIQARSSYTEPAVPINVSALPAVVTHLIAPTVAGFTRKHPNITLSLSDVSHHILLDKSEADITVRLGRPDDPDLMTRRIGTMRFSLYTSQFWQEVPQEDWVFIAYDSTLAHITQRQWLESLLNGRRVIFQASGLMAQQQAARKGLGIVALPCFMDDSDSELVRLPESLPSPVRNIWLVAYPEVKRDRSAIVVMDSLTEIIGRPYPPGKDI